MSLEFYTCLTHSRVRKKYLEQQNKKKGWYYEFSHKDNDESKVGCGNKS